jgi:hypothetical protein
MQASLAPHQFNLANFQGYTSDVHCSRVALQEIHGSVSVPGPLFARASFRKHGTNAAMALEYLEEK